MTGPVKIKIPNRSKLQTTKTDLIFEYKKSTARERDIMWMKYRYLRKLFDEITNPENSPI